MAAGVSKVVLRGSKALRSFVAFYLCKGRLIAADCINRQQEFMAIKKLVQAGFAGDVELLVDESVSLKDLVASLPA